MNKYRELTLKHQEEVNALPLGFAFSDKQFAEMMAKWGLTTEDTDKIYRIGGGGFMRKADSDLIQGTFKRHRKELEEAIAADTTGEGFIYDMFSYELRNHEYAYTGSAEDTLDALGYTWDDVQNDDKLKRGFQLAVEKIANV